METTNPTETESGVNTGTVTNPPPTPVRVHYFKKGNASLPFFVDKQRVSFEVLGGNLGVIATQDATVIAALETAARAKKGIAEIDEVQYGELKKKHPLNPSAKQSQMLRVWDNRQNPSGKSAAANAAAIANQTSPVVADARGVSSVAVGDGAGAGNSPAPFTPALRRKSEGPMLRPPSTGVFREGVLPPSMPQSK